MERMVHTTEATEEGPTNPLRVSPPISENTTQECPRTTGERERAPLKRHRSSDNQDLPQELQLPSVASDDDDVPVAPQIKRQKTFLTASPFSQPTTSPTAGSAAMHHSHTSSRTPGSAPVPPTTTTTTMMPMKSLSIEAITAGTHAPPAMSVVHNDNQQINAMIAGAQYNPERTYAQMILSDMDISCTGVRPGEVIRGTKVVSKGAFLLGMLIIAKPYSFLVTHGIFPPLASKLNALRKYNDIWFLFLQKLSSISFFRQLTFEQRQQWLLAWQNPSIDELTRSAVSSQPIRVQILQTGQSCLLTLEEETINELLVADQPLATTYIDELLVRKAEEDKLNGVRKKKAPELFKAYHWTASSNYTEVSTFAGPVVNLMTGTLLPGFSNVQPIRPPIILLFDMKTSLNPAPTSSSRLSVLPPPPALSLSPTIASPVVPESHQIGILLDDGNNAQGFQRMLWTAANTRDIVMECLREYAQTRSEATRDLFLQHITEQTDTCIQAVVGLSCPLMVSLLKCIIQIRPSHVELQTGEVSAPILLASVVGALLQSPGMFNHELKRASNGVEILVKEIIHLICNESSLSPPDYAKVLTLSTSAFLSVNCKSWVPGPHIVKTYISMALRAWTETQRLTLPDAVTTPNVRKGASEQRLSDVRSDHSLKIGQSPLVSALFWLNQTGYSDTDFAHLSHMAMCDSNVNSDANNTSVDALRAPFSLQVTSGQSVQTAGSEKGVQEGEERRVIPIWQCVTPTSAPDFAYFISYRFINETFTRGVRPLAGIFKEYNKHTKHLNPRSSQLGAYEGLGDQPQPEYSSSDVTPLASPLPHTLAALDKIEVIRQVRAAQRLYLFVKQTTTRIQRGPRVSHSAESGDAGDEWASDSFECDDDDDDNNGGDVQKTRSKRSSAGAVRILTDLDVRSMDEADCAARFYKLPYALDDAWLAGMVGVVEYRGCGQPLLSTLNPNDPYDVVVIAKPTANMKTASVSPEHEEIARKRMLNLLKEKGLAMNKTHPPLPLFKKAFLNLMREDEVREMENGTYSCASSSSAGNPIDLETASSSEDTADVGEFMIRLPTRADMPRVWRRWADVKRGHLYLPFVRDFKEMADQANAMIPEALKSFGMVALAFLFDGAGVQDNAWEVLSKLVKTLNVIVLRKLVHLFGGHKRAIVMPSINQHGGGVADIITHEDVQLCQVLLVLSLFFPSALRVREQSVTHFDVPIPPLLWELRRRISKQLEHIMKGVAKQHISTTAKLGTQRTLHDMHGWTKTQTPSRKRRRNSKQKGGAGTNYFDKDGNRNSGSRRKGKTALAWDCNRLVDKMERTPWKHQIEALEEMKAAHLESKTKGHFIWIPVGLGKTWIVLSYIKYLITSIPVNLMPKYILYTLPSSAIKSIIHEVESFGFDLNLVIPIKSGAKHPLAKYCKRPGTAQVLPFRINLIEHDHIKHCNDVLVDIASECIFVIDEVHKALNNSQRTSTIHNFSRMCREFVALTGTPVIDNNMSKLSWWLGQISSFEVNQRNFWVAVNGMISKKINTGVLVKKKDTMIQLIPQTHSQPQLLSEEASEPPASEETPSDILSKAVDEFFSTERSTGTVEHSTGPVDPSEPISPPESTPTETTGAKGELESSTKVVELECDSLAPAQVEQMKERYQSLVPASLGGTNPSVSHSDIREATDICYELCTHQMVKETLYQTTVKNRGVMLVARNTAHQDQLKRLLIASTKLSEGDIFLIGAGVSIFMTDASVQSGQVPDYKVVITISTKAEGYTLTRLQSMITCVYPSNNATREQLEGRINRIGQAHPIRIITVHAGTLSYIMKKHQQAKNLSSVLATLADEIKLASL